VPVAMVPVVVAMQSSSAPAMQQTFIAVQGEATQTVPAVPTTVPANYLCAIRGNNGCNAPLPAQSNIIQQLLSIRKRSRTTFISSL